MQFLNPAVLVGLIASLAPLVIHLLHRGPSRPVHFSNLLFLRKLHHSRMRRVRLRQWLVLLLRTLIIILIVSAFARPTYRAGAGWWGGASAPVTAVMLVDRSYSTGQRRGGTTAFARLQRRAIQLSQLFSRRDRLTILPFDQAPGPPLPQTANADELERRILSWEPTQAGTDVGRALGAAAGILASAPPGDRELYILSDMARFGWPDSVRDGAAFPAERVHVVAAGGEPGANLWVDSVRVPSWMPAVGRSTTVLATVTNGSPLTRQGVSVELLVDGERVAHESIDLAGGARRRVELKVTPRRAGRLTGYFELEDDVLALDNRAYFILDVPQRIVTLILGETPAATYYLRRALDAAAQTDPALVVRAGLVAALDTLDLSGVDVLFLSNVERLDRQRTAAVREYVAGGGGLALIPGVAADLSYFNRELLPGLIPGVLKGTVGLKDPGFQRLDPHRPHDPMFTSLMLDQAQEDVRFMASFELVPKAGLNALAYFDDGHIALAAGRRGRGRAILWTTPLDLKWSDLPLRGMFVPLCQRMVRTLALPEARSQGYIVGQPVLRPLDEPPAAREVEAETPSGKRLLLQPGLQGSRYYWKIPQADEAGIWRLHQQGTELDRFAVNLDTRESALRTVRVERLQRLFGADRLSVLTPGDDIRARITAQRYGRELWPELLLLAVFLLVVEHWVARSPREAGSEA